MTTSERGDAIAYLAPELPALSATFVYEELLRLERRGYKVIPVSVQRPVAAVRDQAALAARTVCLYDGPPWMTALRGMVALTGFGVRTGHALALLLGDMFECGPLRLISWKLAYQFLAAATLGRHLQREGCRHLHIHFAHTPTQIGMYASALSGVPFTVTAHANDIFERGLLLEKKAARATRLLTISEFNQRFLESLGIPSERLGVVRCGATFQSSSPSTAPPADGTLRIGTLGRMVEKKGFDVLLRAVAACRRRGRRIQLRVAGDGPLRAELGETARTLGISDVVHFDGSLPHSEIAAWMRELDMFVLACKKDRHGDMDGIPVVLMEAMSQSIPVVSTRISGIPELVVDCVTGLLSEPGDADDLAAQIERLADDAQLRAQLIAAARTHVALEFDPERNLDRLVAQFAAPLAVIGP